MSECSFCGVIETSSYPLCQSCGTLRYPVSQPPSKVRYQKLKWCATVAAAVVTPGGFVVLAIVQANRIAAKIKDR
ncbi:MAG: hypothetical protein GQ582_04130 [Methyloprofundus sp.]|nr:hypothetical protein [Methyloprofundus sp.]